MKSAAAVSAGLLDENVLLAFLREKPVGLEVLLTGRDPSKKSGNWPIISGGRMPSSSYEKGVSGTGRELNGKVPAR